MKTLKKFIAALAVGIFMSAGALGCHTVKGAGRDIQSGGKGIENAAEGARK